MTRYLMNKHKTNNMKDKRIPKIVSNSSQSNLQCKRDWHKYGNSWLNNWIVEKEVTLQNMDTIKSTIALKFKEKLWCDKELEDKRKLRYYKEVINHDLEDPQYLFVILSVKKKINIAKIRTNSHELHTEIRHWNFLKRHGMKEFVIFVILRKWRMKNTLS